MSQAGEKACPRPCDQGWTQKALRVDVKLSQSGKDREGHFSHGNRTDLVLGPVRASVSPPHWVSSTELV